MRWPEMKRFLFLLIIVTLLGCPPKKSVPNEKSETFATSKKMQQITNTTTMLKLNVNDQAYYQASVHGSVGEEVQILIDNEGVVKLGDQKVEYKNPERAEMPGGDSATKTFVFKALTIGQAKITIKNLYRGELKSEQVIDCTVSKE